MPPRARPVLAWEIRPCAACPSATATRTCVYFVDAKNGQVLDKWNASTPRRAGVGETLFLGDVACTTDSISGGYQWSTAPAAAATRATAGQGDRQRLQLGRDHDRRGQDWGNNNESDGRLRSLRRALRRGQTWDFYKTTSAATASTTTAWA
jgi:hypothetical protein